MTANWEHEYVAALCERRHLIQCIDVLLLVLVLVLERRDFGLWTLDCGPWTAPVTRHPALVTRAEEFPQIVRLRNSGLDPRPSSLGGIPLGRDAKWVTKKILRFGRKFEIMGLNGPSDVVMKEMILMSHVALGVGCIIATVWLFVDALNARAENLGRIRWMSRAVAACMWLAFVLGGYWYVVDYKVDKAVILHGPWPFAHSLFMETKEHFVITLLLVATYLPIAAANNLAVNHGARRLVLCLAAMVLVLGLMAEGNGGVIAMGVKMGLQGHPQ